MCTKDTGSTRIIEGQKWAQNNYASSVITIVAILSSDYGTKLIAVSGQYFSDISLHTEKTILDGFKLLETCNECGRTK